MTAFVGLDIGTTNVKAAIVEVDDGVRVAARSSIAHKTTRPQPGWAEQDAADWLAGVRQAVSALRFELDRVAGVCVVGQGSTVILSEPGGAPIGPAISWQDLRAASDARRIESELRPLLDRAHGNAIGDAPEPKLVWLVRERPEVVRRARWAFTPASFIAVHLGAAPHISIGDAGSWLSYGRYDADWCYEIADPLELTGLLAEVVPAASDIGHISPAAAHSTGLPAGVPIVAGTTDVASAAIGAGAGRVGDVFYSKGTGGFMCAHVGEEVKHPGRLLALPVGRAGVVQLCGATDTLGAAWDWCRSLLGGLSHAEAEAHARAAPAGSRGVVLLPWLQGAQHPVLRQDARGLAFGLSLETSPGDLLRAVLEGTALGLREHLELASDIAGIEFSLVVSSGGPTHSRLWNELDASATGVTIIVAHESDAAVGAALLAGEAAQAVDDAIEAGSQLRGSGDRYEPDPELARIAAATAELRKELAESALPLFGQLHTLRA